MTTHLFRLRWYTVFFLLGLLVLCTCFAGQIQAELQTAVNRCLTVIIPSLYAMMILSQLFLESGAWQALARPLRRFSTALFGLPESYFALLLLSQFAGYPVGASMLCTLTKQGVLSKEDASRLLCVCYGGGPAFLLGLLGTVSCRRTCFLLIFSANLFANLLLCFLLFHRKPISPPVNGNNAIAPFSAQMLTFAVTSAGRTLLKLCGMILCFAALTGIFQAAGLFRCCTALMQQLGVSFPLADLVRSVLEISNCVELPLPVSLRIPVLAGLLSFGGVCVLLQICAVTGKTISVGKLIWARGFTGLLSGGICAAVLHFFPIAVSEQVLTTSAVPQTAAHPVFPILMLLCMMLLVFREEQKLQRSPCRKKNAA